MLPVIDALTRATCPFPSATMAMINSAALPNVALRNPPHAGPRRCARCSVPSPISAASGTSETAAARKTHDESVPIARIVQQTGTATSSRLRRLSRSARSIDVASVAELLDVFVRRARQQIEEGIEAAIERAAQLRNRTVERVERQAGGRSV